MAACLGLIRIEGAGAWVYFFLASGLRTETSRSFPASYRTFLLSFGRFCHFLTGLPLTRRVTALGGTAHGLALKAARTFLRPPKGRWRHAKNASEVPAQVTLIGKPARRRNFGQRQRRRPLRDQLARAAQSHVQQVMVRRQAGRLFEAAGKMAHTEVGGTRQFAHRAALPKAPLQRSNDGPNARRDARGAPWGLAFRAMHPMQEAKRQRAGQRLKIKRPLHAAVSGLGDQEPA